MNCGRRPRRRARAAAALGLLLALACAAATAQTPLVFAAASLKPALDGIAGKDADGRPAVRISYAATSQLARQIDHGAPADVFISADPEWMDWLQERGRIVPDSRIDLLGNALVLVAPAGRFAGPVALAPGTDLRPLLGDGGRLAVAETGSVPAGRYARSALRWLGAWETLQPHLVTTENVRAALNLAIRGEVPLAIVYRSDARSSDAVQVLAQLPRQSHAAIVYPAALVRDGPAAGAAASWLARLCEPRARAVFRAHGFDLLPGCTNAPPAAAGR